VAPVGFFEGPAPVSIQVAVRGAAEGVANVRPAVSAATTTFTVAASGRLSPLGRTSVTGTLHVARGYEWGTLSLRSPNSNLTLRVSGTAAQGNAPAHLSFVIVNGMGTDPGTTFDFVREEGAGSVDVALTPGPGREPLTLVFHVP
jgi:hypothetical protein